MHTITHTHRFVESRPTTIYMKRKRHPNTTFHVTTGTSADSALWLLHLRRRVVKQIVWSLAWAVFVLNPYLDRVVVSIMLDFHPEIWGNDKIWLNHMFQTTYLGFLTPKKSQGVWLIPLFWNSGCNVCVALVERPAVVGGVYMLHMICIVAV